MWRNCTIGGHADVTSFLIQCCLHPHPQASLPLTSFRVHRTHILLSICPHPRRPVYRSQICTRAGSYALRASRTTHVGRHVPVRPAARVARVSRPSDASVEARCSNGRRLPDEVIIRRRRYFACRTRRGWAAGEPCAALSVAALCSAPMFHTRISLHYNGAAACAIPWTPI